jgi:DNA (cytosine-5)-methyltransferase 1
VRRLTPTECERLQGFPEAWTLPSPKFHLSDEEIDTLRYHAIGNAVAVPVVEWVAKKIRTELKPKSIRELEHNEPNRALDYVRERVPDFAHKKAKLFNIADFVGRDEAPKIKWSSGGVMVEGQCLMTAVSGAPNKIVSTQLVDALDGTYPPAQYFLSANAATGILRRVASQGRELFEPLDAALRRLSNSAVRNTSNKEVAEAT